MSRYDLALEQHVLRAFKTLPKPPQNLLLALSGGVDSMVMAEILRKWRKGLGLSLSVAHIHHGVTQNGTQSIYREKARNLVRAWARENKLTFFTNEAGPSEPLTSEADLRAFREEHLLKFCTIAECDAIAFAHHLDDLLETRLIRLIRGTGHQGLRSMCLYRRNKLRPLLDLARAEIVLYAQVRELKWVEDPSNRKTDALRNWLRQTWLPLLELKRPGALKSLGRSLEMLTSTAAGSAVDLTPYMALRRESLKQKNPREQSALLAKYLKSLGLKGYAKTHVDEIRKRLSGQRGTGEFEMLGRVFKISHDFLWASRV